VLVTLQQKAQTEVRGTRDEDNPMARTRLSQTINMETDPAVSKTRLTK